MQGYGTLQFPERKVFCLAGVLGRVFEVMAVLEGNREGLVREIGGVVL